MIVHFTSSLNNIDERLPTLRAITAVIKNSKHTLSRDWLDEATSSGARNSPSSTEWAKISRLTLDALKKADVVIIEASVDSFSMGFQAALAIQQKKPLLILRSDLNTIEYGLVDAYSSAKPVEHTVIAGDTSSLKRIQAYATIEEAKEAVLEFLKQNQTDKTDMRFNMFLDRETYQYLKNVSLQTGKTKAKIIRDILKEKSQG